MRANQNGSVDLAQIPQSWEEWQLVGTDGNRPIQGNGTYKQDIRCTHWASQSDGGGCMMPQNAQYRITDAFALGQEDKLGNLKWKHGYAGHVFEINAGNGPVQAIVVSTCNINSNTGGVDLITSTWNKVTRNAQPGVVHCSVKLLDVNPMEGGMQCYHRPHSDSSPYYTSVGLFNTGARIVKSAVLEGVQGTFNNPSNGYFDFNSGGRDLFHDNSEITFIFEDGGSVSFKLKECKNPGGVHIFS